MSEPLTMSKEQEAQLRQTRIGEITALQVYGLFKEIDATRAALQKAEEVARELLAALDKFHNMQECAWCYDNGQCDIADTITKHTALLGDPPASGENSR